MTVSGPAPAPAGRGHRFDRSRLTWIDVAVAVGAVLYVVCLSVPWFRYDGYDLGFGYRSASYSVNGFVSGLLTVAAVLVVAAGVWALLPALADVRVPFPRATLTVGLAALTFLLTVVEWLTTFDVGFTLAGLLAVLTSATVVSLAVLRVLPDLRVGPALPEPPASAPPDQPADPAGHRWPGHDDAPRYGGSWQPPQSGPGPSRPPQQP
ncbi:hypothetical protein [Modestobacter marinus]|uniref:hypothetical protein n=1 Tax=Modestobacter marinus TaxID=477641 RepID=UPI001C9551F5|nr:hypothetical protein [Modestobacter marinus]